MAVAHSKQKPSVKHWLKNTVISAIIFIFGFIFGAVIDIIFYQAYIKWDPQENNIQKLIAILILQILFLTLILSYENTYSSIEGLNGVVFRLSLVTSQIFMFKYALERISDFIYHRENEAKIDSPSRALFGN